MPLVASAPAVKTITYSNSQVKIKDLLGVNTVVDEGMVEWKVLDSFGRKVVICLKGYHVPAASVCLLSPQSLFRTVGSKGTQDMDSYILHLNNVNGTSPVASYGWANLPMLWSCRIWCKMRLFLRDELCLQCFGQRHLDTEGAWREKSEHLSGPERHASLSNVHNLA